MSNPYEIYMLQQISLLGQLERLQNLKQLLSMNYAQVSHSLPYNFDVSVQHSLSRSSAPSMLGAARIPMAPLYLGNTMCTNAKEVHQIESKALKKNVTIPQTDPGSASQKAVNNLLHIH